MKHRLAAALLASVLGAAALVFGTMTSATAMEAFADPATGRLTVQMDAHQLDLVAADHDLWEWSVCGDFAGAASGGGVELSWWDCEAYLPDCVSYVQLRAPGHLPLIRFDAPEQLVQCYAV